MAHAKLKIYYMPTGDVLGAKSLADGYQWGKQGIGTRIARSDVTIAPALSSRWEANPVHTATLGVRMHEADGDKS